VPVRPSGKGRLEISESVGKWFIFGYAAAVIINIIISTVINNGMY
jgi:hypothetical protein